MTNDERKQIEEMKRERAEITDVIERIAFDNGADGKPLALHIIAALDSDG